MAREPKNPDRNFSADGDPEETLEGLRNALDHNEPAMPFDEVAKARIGKVISGAVLKDSATERRSRQKPNWRARR
jgi:hypothetical protein